MDQKHFPMNGVTKSVAVTPLLPHTKRNRMQSPQMAVSLKYHPVRWIEAGIR